MNWRTFFRGLLAVFFIGAGANHFRDVEFYQTMMPPWLPWHLPLIYASGVAEILGGLGVLLPATRRLAGWGLIVLLLAIFPANLHLALHHVSVPGLNIPAWVLWARLPFQAVFIAWVWWTALAPDRAAARPAS